jgi:hypothetical protein
LAAVGGILAGDAQVQVLDSFHKSELISLPSFNGAASLGGGSGSFTGQGSPPRVGDNVQVNEVQVAPPGLLGRSETSIVADRGGQRLVAGWNDADGFVGLQPGLSGFGFSRDGGKTWIDGGAPFIDNIFTFGDPWLDRGGFDKDTIYYSNIGQDLATEQFGISIHRGHFGTGAFAWEDVRFVVPVVTTGPGGGDFLDKEAIAAAKDGSGSVVLSLTNFLDLGARSRCPASSPIGFGQIEVYRSTDGGDTYQGPIVVGPDLTNFAADPNCNVGVSQQSSSPAFGPDGEVYVVWERGPTFTATSVSSGAEIVVAASTNGGASFGPPVVVSPINHMRGAPPVAYNRNRINNHPRIAVAQDGAFKGRVYVTYSSLVAPVSGVPVIVTCPVTSTVPCVAQNTTSSQVFLSYSDDGGATWSTPVPLAPAPPANGLKRFWPTVSVEPGGNVDVIYYESQEVGLTANPTDIECNRALQGARRRAGPAVSLMDTQWVRSSNGGASFNGATRVTSVSTNWCAVASNIVPNMGDYIFSVSTGNHVYPAWADGRNGVPDTFYALGLGAGKSNK